MGDTNNICEVRRELSQFASELINQLRAQNGNRWNLTNAIIFRVCWQSFQALQKWQLELGLDELSPWYLWQLRLREYGLAYDHFWARATRASILWNAYIWRAYHSSDERGRYEAQHLLSLCWICIMAMNGFMPNQFLIYHGSQTNYLGVDFYGEWYHVAHFTMVSEDQVKYATKNVTSMLHL